MQYLLFIYLYISIYIALEQVALEGSLLKLSHYMFLDTLNLTE